MPTHSDDENSTSGVMECPSATLLASPPMWLSAIVLMAVLALAWTLRTSGVHFGEPCSGVRLDEEISLREALYLLEGNPHIHFFNYPPGLMILNALWIGSAQRLGIIKETGLAGFAEYPMPFHVAVRYLSALLGTMTVLLVFLIGCALFNRGTGLVAALILAVFPLHVLNSHFGTLDVPGAFFMAASLAIVLVPRGQPFVLWRLLFGAFVAGAAAGIKYPFGAVVFVPMAIGFLRFRHGIRTAIAVGAVAFLGFLVIAPTFLTQHQDALTGIREEAGAQEFARGRWTGPNPFFYHFWNSLTAGSGYTIMACFLGGLMTAFRKARSTLLVLLPAAILYLVHGFKGNVFLRYMIPVVPMIAVFAGYFLMQSRFWRRPMVGILLLIVVLAYPLWTSTRVITSLRAKDSRGELLEAFQDGRLPRSSVILVPPYPFLVFPFASMTQVVQSNSRRSNEDPCSKNIEMAVQRVIRNLADGPAPLDVRAYDVGSFPLMLNGLKEREILMIVPSAFAPSYFEFHRRQVARMQEAALQGDIEFSHVLRIDPTEGKGFPPRSEYDPHDFWFIPITNPVPAARPGPVIDVYRVYVRNDVR